MRVSCMLPVQAVPQNESAIVLHPSSVCCAVSPDARQAPAPPDQKSRDLAPLAHPREA